MKSIYGVEGSAAAFVSEAAAVARDVASKHVADVDGSGRFPTESLSALGAQGLLGLNVPTSHGGKGQGPRTFAAVVEELAQACSSTAMVYVMHIVATQVLVSSSKLGNKDAILRDIAGGKHLTTLALSEKGSRSNFWMPASKLEPRASGYVTSAFKSFVTSANHAHTYVSASQKPGAASPLESTCYVVRREANGVRPSPRFDGMGLRGNDSNPVSIEDYEIREEDLLDDHGKGIETLLQVVLPWFAVGTAAMSNGLCRAAVSATAQHLSSTSLDGGARLRDFPNLRARIAQMSLRTEQSRALLAHTLTLLEQPTELTPLYVLQSRQAALEAAVEVTDLGMKACGGAAFSKHLSLERLFRDARAGWVMSPTVDHLQDFVGKALTGLPLL